MTSTRTLKSSKRRWIRRGGQLLGALCLVSSIGCNALSDSKLLSFGVEYWDAEPGGALASSEFGVVGDQIDVDSTLSIDDEKVWVYHASATLGPTLIQATWLDLSSSGLSTLSNSVIFSGQNFAAGNTVASELDTTVLQLHTETGLYNWNIVRFGFLAGIDQLQIDATLNDQDALITADQSYDGWIPVIGVTAGVNFPLWIIEVFAEGKVSGIIEELALDTLDGDYLSSTIKGGVNLDDGFKLGIGYRSLEAEFEEGGADFDFDLGGGFLFVEVEF